MEGEYSDFRRIKIAWIYLCVACCTATLFINEVYLGGSARWLFVLPALIFAIARLSRLSRSARELEAACLLSTGLLTAVCFSLQATLVQQTTEWFMPIGLVITLTMATLFDHVRIYAGASLLIWGLTFLIVNPAFPGPAETAYASVMCLGSILVAVFLCHVISRTRRENARLFEQMRHQATIDPLTGLLNRRAFLQHASLQDGAAGGHVAYFAMVDVDDFKSINDRHGHATGDAVLVAVGEALRRSVPGGLAGRLGGEEFGVWFEADSQAAAGIAEGLLESVRRIRTQGVQPTVSVGLGRWVAGEPLSDLLRRADEALYQAKRGGKDKAVLAPDAARR